MDCCGSGNLQTCAVRNAALAAACVNKLSEVLCNLQIIILGAKPPHTTAPTHPDEPTAYRSFTTDYIPILWHMSIASSELCHLPAMLPALRVRVVLAVLRLVVMCGCLPLCLMSSILPLPAGWGGWLVGCVSLSCSCRVLSVFWPGLAGRAAQSSSYSHSLSLAGHTPKRLVVLICE